MPYNVACLGEAMVELSLSDETPDRAAIGFAGDTLNTAIYLKRNSPGTDVAYVTKIGNDRLSERMLAMMEGESLNTDLVLRSQTRLPGLYAIATDAAGERSFLYWRDTSAARALFRPPALALSDLASFDVLYFSAISLAILPQDDRHHFLHSLAAYRAGGGLVAFDSNYRPRLWPDAETARRDVEAAWRATDIGLPSVDDEMALFGDPDADAVIHRLNRWGVTSGALKCGDKGPRSLDKTPAPNCPPAPRVIDSTAAGDSFNGGYLAARFSGQDQTTALAAGHALASQVVQHRGAILPRQKEDLT